MSKIIVTTALFVTLLPASARADCAAASECICPSLDPVALIEGKVLSTHSNGMRLEVLAIHPASAATQVPYTVGNAVDVARHVKSGETPVGGRVLAPVFHYDFGAGKPGEKTWEIADMVGVDADDHVTCSYAPAFRLSRQETLRVMLLPVQQCHQELGARGVADSYSCDDTVEGCFASVGGRGGSPASFGLVLLLLVLCVRRPRTGP